MTIKHRPGSGSSRGRKLARVGRLPLAIEVLEQRLAPASILPGLHFDGSAGALSLAGSTAVVRGLAGGIAVSLNGHLHSSDPTAASFDPALAGASAAGLRQIRLSGGGRADSLTLGTLMDSKALAVRSDGSVSVAGTVRAAGLTVTAAGLLDVEAGGRLAARGGFIALAADQLVNTGRIDAGGTAGGTVSVKAHDYLGAGQVSAAGSSGAGGSVQIGFSHSYIDTATAMTTVSGSTGGLISVRGGGRLFSSGRFLATGTSGGSVDLLGHEVLLVAATVDASGTAAGGRIRIGGDYQGGGTLPTAATVGVSPASSLRADGSPAGLVIVWSAVQTTFSGTVSAHGSGKSGFIEVSSSGQLDYGGKANAGQGGTLLLDPHNLTIQKGGTGGTFPQFNLVNPGSGGAFGTQILTLATGNEIVTDPSVNSSKGAVYLFDGRTGALLGTLQGSSNGDQVGSNGVTALTNGNYVVSSPRWNSQGAATWGNGTTGTSGTVSSSNSLVGGGSEKVIALVNGNYVVRNSNWNNNLGAVTWCSGTGGTTGAVSASNSLVGSTAGYSAPDNVGSGGVTALPNGNYVVASPAWNNYEGAVTWCSGTGSTTGAVSASNSLVGSSTGYNSGDHIGSGGVTALPNGNYVVVSPRWNSYEGAVTWGPGASGVIGPLSSANSIVGSTGGTYPGEGDEVGNGGVTVVANGNYVVVSPDWNNAEGAVTWCSGSTETTGTLSASNSLVGSSSNDRVGNAGVTALLTNGNYVVSSPWWGSGGAVTWGNGTTGITGTISSSNSLLLDRLDSSTDTVTALTNGNYVVASRGFVTWGNGSTGISGTVSASNSLVDSGSVTALTNGNYVVVGGGFATWGDGSTGSTGTVSASNSLVDSGSVTALPNGDYLVDNSSWNNNQGAVTWVDGSGPATGIVSASNSIVGPSGGSPGDQVGSGGVVTLPNSNFVVLSPSWNNSRGAATWGNGTTGTTETVGSSNSLIGTTGGSTGDRVGSGGGTVLTDGNIVVSSPKWNTSAGSVTWMDASNGTTLDGQSSPDAGNGLVGASSSTALGPVQLGAIKGSFVAAFPGETGGGRVTVGFVPSGGSGDGQLAYGFAPNLDLTESPDIFAETLAAGTDVVLQANNDIIVNSPISVVTQGKPGNLTLQAGRSILLGAGINTAGGNLTLLANDTRADGVVDSHRDAGNAAITMATGINLNAGGGNLFVDLETSTDKTNNGKGVATLLGLTAGLTTLSKDTVLGVTINGPTAGDGITTGTYTQTSVTGPINLNNATLQLTHVPATSVVNETFTIVHSTSGVSGTFAGLPEGGNITASDGTLYSISYADNGGQDVVLTQRAIPTQLQVLQQPPVSVTAGAAFSVKINVEDAQGNVALGYSGPVTIALANNPTGATLSGTLTVQARDGVATFSDLSLDKAGSGYTLQATCPNLTPIATSAFDVTAGTPTHLVFHTGLPSNITAGVPVSPAVVVYVEDLFGNVVLTDDSSVTITVHTGPGSVGGTVTVVAVNGVATFDNLVFDTAGTYTLQAGDSDDNVSSPPGDPAPVQPAGPDHVGFDPSWQPGTILAGQAISPAVVVNVYDQYGNVQTSNSSIQVTISINSGPGTFTAGSTLTVTVVNGVATFSNLVLGATGTYSFAIRGTGGLGGSPSDPVTVDPGTPDHLFIGPVSDGPAGSPLAPAVQVAVVDHYGNLVDSDNTDQVSISVASGPGGFAAGSTTTLTVSAGVAVFDNLVLDKAGNYTLAASSGSIKSQPSGSFAITPLAPDHLGYGTLPVSATAGQALAPAFTVELFDTFNNLATNDNTDTVTVYVATGPGTFTADSTTTVTVQGGVATFSKLILTVAGDYTFLVATTANGGMNGTATGSVPVNPGAADHLVFLQQPSDTPAGSAIGPALTVQLYDHFNNPLNNDNQDPVTIQVASGPGNFTPGSTTTVVVSGGLATFSNLVLTAAGSYTLKATGPNAVTGSPSSSFSVSGLSADHLAFGVQPSDTQAGSPINPAVTVRVLDKYGNLVDVDNGDQVTLSVASGPGDFSPGSTRTATVSNGVASFPNLIIDTAGQYTLAATSSLSGPASNSFTVRPASADRLAFVQPPNTVAGVAFSVAVTLLDRFGNLLGDSTDQVTLTVVSCSGNVPVITPPPASVSSGAATFNLVLDTAGSYSLLFTVPGVPNGVTSNCFTVSPAAPDHLAFSVPPGNTTAGLAITPAVQVQVLDRFNNLLTQDNTDQVTISVASGPGPLAAGSTTTLTVSGGGAIFSNLVLDTAGSYTLTASSGSLMSPVSGTFLINPATADHLTILLQPNRITAGTLLEVQVAVEDKFNNPVTNDSSTVCVTLAGNPPRVILGGILCEPPVNGIATFNDLTISAAGSYSIQVSHGGLTGATSPIEVDQLLLSSTSVPEFRPTGTVVGTLNVQGGSGHSYHYAMVHGASSPDARSFTLNGNQLLTADAFDFAAKSSYTVRVRATDEKGFNVDQVFTIRVQADPRLSRSGKTLTVKGSKGKDTFSFTPGGAQDSLTLNGTKLSVDTARVNKVVFQGGGGSDSATLSGSAGVDTLTLSPTGGTLAGPRYMVTLKGVGHVTATGGLKDVARLTGSAGSDTFTGTKGSSTLSGKGYSLTVLGFVTVSVNGGKGTNKGVLSDSKGNDSFVGSKGTGTLSGVGYSIVFTGLEDVTLNGKAGGKNTIHLAQVSYKLHQNGVWVKV